MKKKYSLVLLILILFGSAFAIGSVLTTIELGTVSAINITFNSAGSNTSLYFSLPSNSYVFNATMNVSGFMPITESVDFDSPSVVNQYCIICAFCGNAYCMGVYEDILYNSITVVNITKTVYNATILELGGCAGNVCAGRDYKLNISVCKSNQNNPSGSSCTDTPIVIANEVSVTGGSAGSNCRTTITLQNNYDFLESVQYYRMEINTTLADEGGIWGNNILSIHGEIYAPTNVSIDIETDGDNEYFLSGDLNSTNSPHLFNYTNFTTSLRNYIDNTCSTDPCNITINVSSDTAGILQLNAIEINYNEFIEFNANYTMPLTLNWSDSINATVNVTDADGDTIQYVNFTVYYPNTTEKCASTNGTHSGDLWNMSNSCTIDQEGNWNISVEAYDGVNTTTLSWKFLIWLGNITILPTSRTYSQQAGTSEIFNIDFSHNGTQCVNYTINYTGAMNITLTPNNFTTSLNNTNLQVCEGNTEVLEVNITSNSSLANGEYLSNITITRAEDSNLIERFPITATIATTVGNIVRSPILRVTSMSQAGVEDWTLTLTNDGTANLTSCNLTAGSTISSFTSFINQSVGINYSNFNVTNTTLGELFTVRYTTPTAGSYNDNLNINCTATAGGALDIETVGLTISVAGETTGIGGTGAPPITIIEEAVNITPITRKSKVVLYFPYSFLGLSENVVQRKEIELHTERVTESCSSSNPDIVCEVLRDFDILVYTIIESDDFFSKEISGEITIISPTGVKAQVPVSFQLWNMGYFWSMTPRDKLLGFWTPTNNMLWKINDSGQVIGIRLLIPIVLLTFLSLASLIYYSTYQVKKRKARFPEPDWTV